MFPTFLFQTNRIYVFNHLRINKAQQRHFFDIHATVRASTTLRLLVKLGLVRRFFKINETKFRVLPNRTFNNTQHRPIKIYSSKQNPLRLSLSTLRLLKINTGASSLILSTSKGLLTHQQALNYKVGGHLFCIIY